MKEITYNKNQKKDLLWIIFIFLLGLILRSLYLNRSLGGGDENQYLLDYGDASFGFITHTYFHGGHHVFYTVLMRLMIILFGDENAIAIRLPSYIAGLFTLALIYRIANYLFHSEFVCRIALLLAAVCPVHIYYSQVARGYSLIIFFSALAILSSLNLLEADHANLKWSSLLVLSGFFSVYTIPTNVYFLFGLSSWVLFVILKSCYTHQVKYHVAKSLFKKFSLIFLSTALLCIIAYWPLRDLLFQEAREYHLTKTGNLTGLTLTFRLLWDLWEKVYPVTTVWMMPFLVASMFSPIIRKKQYRWFLVCIVFLPLLIPLITGIGGYARNYLYNFPLLIIYTAAGIHQVAIWISQMGAWISFSKFLGIISIGYSLGGIYTTFFQTFPSMISDKGKSYGKLIKENTLSNDLILIADTGNYLYAQNIFKNNLRSILQKNRISNVMMVAPNHQTIFNHRISDGLNSFGIFKSLSKLIKFPEIDVGGRQFLYKIGKAGISLLAKDFATKAGWRSILGEGSNVIEKNYHFDGKSSLKLQTGSKLLWSLQAPIAGRISLERPSLIVLIWVLHDLNNKYREFSFAIPSIIFYDTNYKKYRILKVGQVNRGIIPRFRGKAYKGNPLFWKVFVFIGTIPPGEYLMNIRLALLPEQNLLIDSLRLFLVDIPFSSGYK